MILTNSGVLKLMQRIKSFITAQLNTKANSVHTHTISEIDDLSSLQMGGYTKSEVDTLLTGKADTGHTHTVSDVTDFPTLSTVATSGSYNDLSNKPTIPIVDSALSSTSTNALQNKVINTELSKKANTSHTHTVSDVTDFPSLATVATSGSYNDLSNKPTTMTPTSHTHGNITNDGKIGSNANKPLITTTGGTVTTGSFGTSANTFCEGNDSRLSDARTPTAHNHSASEITSGTLDSARIPNLDASKITSGTIDIDRLPAGALERLVIVADQTARYALTTSSVQLGDTVKQLDTGIMYYVVDTSKLNSADGYSEYTAGSATSVPWSGVTGKPSSFTPSSHTHTTSDITDFPSLATVATSGSYNDLSNKPAIPTYSAGTNLSLSDTTFNVSSTPSFTSITISDYTITVD